MKKTVTSTFSVSAVKDGAKGEKGDKGDQGIRGLQGLQGEKGDQGIPGKDGVSTYFHIAYADNATGGGFSQNPTGKNYIGTYVDHTATDSTNPSAYKWQLVKGAQGEKGEKGIPGTNGNDGKTSYLHIAYANSADGKTGFDVSNSTGKLYIGQYVDFTEADSTDPTKYTWTKIKGDDGKSPRPNLCRYNCLIKDTVKSLSYDLQSNTYTIVNNTPNNWGSQVYLSPILIPYGERYTASADVYSPVAADIIIDFNNSAIIGSNWSGNDNDEKGKRLPLSTDGSSFMKVPANTWTTISWSAINSSSGNTDKVDISIYDAIGSTAPADTVWKIRNLKVEFGDTATPWVPNKEDVVGEKGEKGDKGDTGSTGPVMYNAGKWSSATQYINNGKATPMVMTESSSGGITSRNYWYLPNVGSSTNQDPRNGAPWEEVTGYAALFAEMAIINGGTLNDAVFKDGWMFSKAGRYMSNESYVYTTYNDTNWTNFDPTVYNSSDEASWRPLVAIDFRNGKAYYTDSINATGGEFNGNFSAYRNRIKIGKIQSNSYADSDLYGVRFSDSHETECGSIVQFTDSNVSQCALTLTAIDYSSSSPQEIGSLDIAPTTGIAHTASGTFSLLQNWSIGKYGDCLGLKSTTRVIPSYFPDDSLDMSSEESGTFYVFDNGHDLTINLPKESLDGFTFEFKAINHPINLKVKNNSHSIVFQDEAQSNRKEQRIEDSVPRKYIYAQGRWFEMSYHH